MPSSIPNIPNQSLSQAPTGFIDSMTLKDWLCDEPFTLTLSSGFFGFFAHCGLISVLDEENLIPEAITGCSAGALTGALWASGMPVDEIMGFYQGVKKEAFWDPGFGLGILKGKKFRDLLSDHCPVENLEDCPLPISVSTFDVLTQRTKVFNSGSLANAVYASCSIPPLFQPIWMDGRLYSDGAFKDSPGLVGVNDGSRVLYHQLQSRSKRRATKKLARHLQPHKSRLEIHTIAVSNVPKVDPNHLETGPLAYEMVRNAVLKSLTQPLDVGCSN